MIRSVRAGPLEGTPSLVAAALAVAPASAAAAAATTTAVEIAAAVAAAAAVTAVAATTATVATTAAAKPATTTTEPTACAGAGAGKVPGLGLEAVTAIHRTVAARLEGDFCFLATGRTCGIEHLPGWTVFETTSAATSGLALPQPAAVRTTPRLFGEPLRSMELLLTRGEHKRRSAIAADKRLVGVGHPMTLLNIVEPTVIERRGTSLTSP